MPSYDSVNYSLRPAKNIERKMFCEAFRKLSEFGSLDSYRYIGFGSPFFSDFSLFHKSLNITNAISIEEELGDEARFIFNRPYACIELIMGTSNDILPTLQWNLRTILWLDYDSPLDQSILSDVATICSNIFPGSFLIITVDAKPGKYGSRLESIKERIGEEKLPEGLSEARLSDWDTAKTYKRIISNEIAQTLNYRNGARPEGTRIVFKQIFNFHYADGAEMLTLGGILHEEGQKNIVAKCGFKDLDFFRDGEEPYEIVIPKLTLKEIRHINRQLPCPDLSQVSSPAIEPSVIASYAKIYRYFPNFVDAEIG